MRTCITDRRTGLTDEGYFKSFKDQSVGPLICFFTSILVPSLHIRANPTGERGGG